MLIVTRVYPPDDFSAAPDVFVLELDDEYTKTLLRHCDVVEEIKETGNSLLSHVSFWASSGSYYEDECHALAEMAYAYELFVVDTGKSVSDLIGHEPYELDDIKYHSVRVYPGGLLAFNAAYENAGGFFESATVPIRKIVRDECERGELVYSRFSEEEFLKLHEEKKAELDEPLAMPEERGL